jgi:hypothetical protein
VHRWIDIVFAKPFRQSRHLQQVTQRFIRPRNPQFDADSLQVCIQCLQRLRRFRIEIADGTSAAKTVIATTSSVRSSAEFTPLKRARPGMNRAMLLDGEDELLISHLR